MAEVNWALGLQRTNPGEAFTNAFKEGQQTARQNRARAAMAALARDPNNEAAFQALAEVDPQSAMQLREHRRKEAMAGLESHRENLLKGAQIVRQVQPKDQASWDQTRAIAAQMGLNISEVPQVWDENAQRYVQGLTAIADAFAPQKQEGTTLQRDYEFLKGQNPELAEQYLRNKAEGGPLIANNGDGTFTIIPRGIAQPTAPKPSGGAPPPPPPGFVLDNDGGPAAPPPGTFPQ